MDDALCIVGKDGFSNHRKLFRIPTIGLASSLKLLRNHALFRVRSTMPWYLPMLLYTYLTGVKNNQKTLQGRIWLETSSVSSTICSSFMFPNKLRNFLYSLSVIQWEWNWYPSPSLTSPFFVYSNLWGKQWEKHKEIGTFKAY